MIAIIDYDAGNIKSVEKALKYLGADPVLTRDPEVIAEAERVILPGVGAFGDAMERLGYFELTEPVKKAAGSGKPFLGICLGLQLLFEESDEAPGVKGLSLLRGRVKKLPGGEGLKVPDIGWNSLKLPRKSRLFTEEDEGAFVYFVHSYYLEAADRGIVTSQIDYGVAVDASVESGNVFAVQFHPEKSSDTGLGILQRFLRV
ncbi:MAG: imidazole glycerol phosphate synthase subunit HisH [Lachnospiraceae bacterium]|nr:imidazole glycerol phosphate synthase subunit HisH [Lachnospiraceae bacterium]